LVALPALAQAQAPVQVRRVGMLIGYAESDPEIRARLLAFRQGMEKFGWKEGHNLQIDTRFAPAGPSQAQVFANELVALQPNVLLGNSTPATAALQRATQTIPIVFVGVSDPLGSGLVASIARPGGNTTGFTNFDPSLIGKWLSMLKELAPHIMRAAVIFNPETAPDGGAFFLQPFEGAARSLSMDPIAAPVRDDAAIDKALTALAREPGGSVVVMPDAFTTVHRGAIIDLAARHRLPAIYPYRYHTAAGGLISYGVDTVDLFRRAAPYLDRILKGEKPGDLAVQAPVKFELVINLKTAKALGLTMPPTLLVTADEVIE
jgi:putative ABC transport system substrate-binding protein